MTIISKLVGILSGNGFPAVDSGNETITFSDASDKEYLLKLGKIDRPETEYELWDVYLEECGDRKIHVIKTVRTYSHIGLKEAKELVDATGTSKWNPLTNSWGSGLQTPTPQLVAKDLTSEIKDCVVGELHAAGAKVSVHRSYITMKDINSARDALKEIEIELDPQPEPEILDPIPLVSCSISHNAGNYTFTLGRSQQVLIGDHWYEINFKAAKK